MNENGMCLIRQPDGGAPRAYPVAALELPRVWRWKHAGSAGISALGRTREEAELLMRDAQAWGKHATAVA